MLHFLAREVAVQSAKKLHLDRKRRERDNHSGRGTGRGAGESSGQNRGGRGRGTGTSLLASPWPPLVIPVHPPPVALPFIQPGHSWQHRAPAGSGLINPLGEPLCRSLLGLLPGQEGTPQGSRLINPLGELLRPSPPVGYHHYVIGAHYLWPEVVTPSPLPPDLRQLAQSVGPSLADHLQWVEMFSAQQKVLPLVGRSLLPPVAPPLDPTKVRLLTRSMSQTAYRSLTTVSYAKTRRDLSLGRSAIAELVDLKVVEPCLDPLFIWPWFMDHQSNGRTRLVVDPSPLNDCVTAEVSVTFDSLEKVVTRIMSSDVIWSCDLRKAYHQTPLLPWFRRFVCIKEEGVVYQFNATLLGFNWAPKMFFYAVLPLTSALAALGLRTSVYVDDMLGASHPSQALVEVRMAVMAWCFNCWSLNWEKSVLIPQSSLRHCGFEVIVPQMSFGVPADKVRDIRNLALSLWNRETVRRISIAKIVGKVLSIARAFRPSRRITWSLILDLYPREMNFSSLHWGDRVRLSELSREDLLWIHQHLLLPQLTTRSWLPSTTFLVFTDASLWGWGIHIPSLHWFDSGQWSPQEGSLHINVLEVLAVAKGLDQAPPSLCPDRLEGITLVTDNSTARRYINAQGGRRSEDLCFHTFHLLRALEAKSWWIPNAVWIPSRLNLVADLLSRGKPLSPVGARLLYRSICETTNVSPTGLASTDFSLVLAPSPLTSGPSGCPNMADTREPFGAL